jgi:RNA polymerase sigma-70 factor (ECF subfamily)
LVTDHSLLARLRSGESEAANALYYRYADHLRNLVAKRTSPQLATRVDSDDIVQSVFRTLFRRVFQNHYDVPRGEDLWKLILVIALNKVRNAANHHTSAKRDLRRTVGIDDACPAGIPGSDETNLATLKMVVAELTERLSADARQIVELRIDGYDVNEIATKTGRAKRSVERMLQQFREQLRIALHDDEDTDVRAAPVAAD